MRKLDAKGFTLIELVIVIVIVGILAIVAVPIYRTYIRRSMATEGTTAAGAIKTHAEAYFAEHASLTGLPVQAAQTGYSTAIDIDMKANKYFKSFTLTYTSPRYTGTVFGFGDAANCSVVVSGDCSSPAVINVVMP